MKKFLFIVIYILGVFGLGSLIMWGLGNLVIWVFKINYTWTFLHGFVMMLLYNLIEGIFDKGGNK